MAPLVVGFDLDMTLIDSRPAVGATLTALAAETGVRIDVAAAVSRLGPPLEVELARWFPAAEVDRAADRYRELYADPALGAVRAALPLPGAREALAAVRRRGGRVLVVTAKHEPNARRHLDHLGLDVDAVRGDRFGPAKGEVLAADGALAYVGDHPGDVVAARAAGALSITVASGGTLAEELRAAGADVVLPDLHAFPPLLDTLVSAAVVSR